MADFETKLTLLAERGTRVGPEEMIARVERQLAGHPLVAADKQRKGTLMTKTLERVDSGTPPGRHKIGWALAAFVAVLGLGALLFALSRSDTPADPAAPTPAPITETETLSAEEEARQIVDAAFAAHNSGDYAKWVLWREGGEILPPDDADAAYFLAVGARLDVDDCTYRGFGDWTIDFRMTGHGFDCAVTYTDRLLEAAGIELQMTYNWIIGTDPESSIGGSNENGQAFDEFFDAYQVWLTANHPEVCVYRCRGGIDLADVPLLLEHVDEFVAQSDRYPLTEPVPESPDYGGPLR